MFQYLTCDPSLDCIIPFYDLSKYILSFFLVFFCVGGKWEGRWTPLEQTYHRPGCSISITVSQNPFLGLECKKQQTAEDDTCTLHSNTSSGFGSYYTEYSWNLSHGIIHRQRMVWVERDFQRSSNSSPPNDQGISFHPCLPLLMECAKLSYSQSVFSLFSPAFS